jgi:hypothetical protein
MTSDHNEQKSQSTAAQLARQHKVALQEQLEVFLR